MFGPIATSDGYVMVAIASEKTFQRLMRRDRPSRMDQRSALREICRPPRQLGGPDGRRRGLVAHADDGAMPGRAERSRRAGLGLSHRGRSAGRSADRPSRRAGRGRGWRRHLQGDQSAVPDVGRRRFAPGKRDGRRSASTRVRSCKRPAFPRRDRGLRGQDRLALRREADCVSTAFVSPADVAWCGDKKRIPGETR